MQQLSNHQGKSILNPIYCRFENEIGIDEGGLVRELFNNSVEELFSPKFGLFKIGEGSDHNLIINPDSIAIPFYEKYFELAGILIGKALIQGICIDASLSRYLLKTLQGFRLTIGDLQDFDSATFDSMKYLIETPGAGEILEVDFTYNSKILGQDYSRVLIPKGQNHMVDDENKEFYVKLYCESQMITETEPQLNALLRGFRTIIPLELVSDIKPFDFSLLITGPSEIDLKQMKDTCGYSSGYKSNDQVILWFWEVLQEFDQIDLSKFLLFLSGSSRPPFGGFQNSGKRVRLRKINNDYSLPVAHTCFYELDLPEYKEKSVLKDKLVFAINNGKDFHLG